MMRAFLFSLIAITIFLMGVALFFGRIEPGSRSSVISQTENELSAVNIPVNFIEQYQLDASSSTETPTTTVIRAVSGYTSKPAVAKKASNKGVISASAPAAQEVERIQNPYSTSPESFDQINADARSALVNILCQPQGGSSLDPISGSGVIIDPKGIILTNAHVAQYVLLSESAQINLTCFVRTGSPATAQWSAAVLYVPQAWVDQHVHEITESHPIGTGEHDYALLYITGSVNGRQLPAQFPYLPIDTRPAIGFPGDQVLVASYPAELVGGIAAQYDLYADTSITTIKQLLTFGSGTPDVVSLGGIIEAQSGSSGGAVVNQWGRLVALIATTSAGPTTSDRDLRGVALSYINADLETQLGIDLNVFLLGNPVAELHNFSVTTAPDLLQLYIKQLTLAQ